MKLLRFITQEEYEKVVEISKRSDLITDNDRAYYHAENMKEDEDVIYMNTLLKQVVEGFRSFSNFTKANHENIRIQYAWDERFVGVGWITITELRDGFEVIEVKEALL